MSKDLSKEPSEGRLDVLAYRIVERVATAIEDHNPMLKGKLWSQADKPIQQLIRQRVPNMEINLPPELGTLLMGKKKETE